MIDRTGLEEAIRRAADPAVLTQRVADEAMALIAGVDGVLVGFVHDRGWLTFECVAGASFGGQIGSRIPLDGSLVGLAFETGETLYADDAENDSRVEQNFRRAVGVQSLVCVPLWRRTETVGVLCVTSSRPRVFNDRDIATLTCLAEFISVLIGVAVDLAGAVDSLLNRSYRDTPGAAVAKGDDLAAEERFVANILNPGTLSRLENRSRIDRFLKGRGLTHVFQPVFDMTSGDCFAVEALARFSGRPKRTPDVWFAEAHSLGVGAELEIASVKGALSSLHLLPEVVTLCVNAGPEAIVSDEVCHLLAECDSRRVVIELTEETKVDDYPGLSRVLDKLCLLGVRLAIDDTGAGFASFAHILKLAPDIIKLDRELTSGIDHDPVRAALATALVSFASGIGADIIAEGIETPAELEMLRSLGIRYGQGYLLCRPTSIDLIPGSLPQDAWLATTEAAASKAS